VHDPRSPPGIVEGQQRGLRFGGQGLVRRRDQAPGAEKGEGRMVVSYIYICIVKICLIYGMIYGMIYRLDRMDMYVQYGYIIYGYYTWILYLDI
jgi:hypothetical protein